MRAWLNWIGAYLKHQAMLQDRSKSRSHTAKGPGIMRYRGAGPGRMAGNKLWRKACEGKL